jgi:hypothetical protein
LCPVVPLPQWAKAFRDVDWRGPGPHKTVSR